MPNTEPVSHSGTILSGMRPTGQLHLGNYFGALQNWVALQDSYQCIYTIVDIHALTTIETFKCSPSCKVKYEKMKGSKTILSHA